MILHHLHGTDIVRRDPLRGDAVLTSEEILPLDVEAIDLLALIEHLPGGLYLESRHPLEHITDVPITLLGKRGD